MSHVEVVIHTRLSACTHRPSHCSGRVASKLFLDTHAKVYTSAEVKLRIGPALGEHKVDCLMVSMARSGCFMFFSIASLYVALGFQMYSGVASRWAWEVLGACERFMADFGDGHVARSMPYGSKGDDNEIRIFPWHSVTSIGLVALLARWSSAATRAAGALASPQARQAASLMLESVCDLVVRGTVLQFFVYMDDDFEWRWPRPALGDHGISILVEDRSTRYTDYPGAMLQAKIPTETT